MTYIKTNVYNHMPNSTMKSCRINFVLDYSGSTKIINNPTYSYSNEPIYAVRPKVRIDSMSCNMLDNVIIDGNKIDSILGYVQTEIYRGALSPPFTTSNPFNLEIKKKPDKILDNGNGWISYTRFDSIIYNKDLNLRISKHTCYDYFKSNISCNSYSYYSTTFKSQSESYEKGNWASLFRNNSICCLKMDFNLLDVYTKTEDISIKIDFLAPMYYANVAPEPDERTMSTISYTNPEKLKEVYKNGIYVYAESLSNKKAFDNRNFILATIIGGLISLLADAIYRIFNMNTKKEKE